MYSSEANNRDRRLVGEGNDAHLEEGNNSIFHVIPRKINHAKKNVNVRVTNGFRKYAIFLLENSWLMFLFAFIGLVNISFIFYTGYITELTMYRQPNYGFGEASQRYYTENSFLNLKTMDTLLNESSMSIGKNRKHFYESFGKDKNAALLVYIDRDFSKLKGKEFISKFSLRDIFYLLYNFQTMKISNGLSWKDICQMYNLPMLGRSCLIGGFFNTNYIMHASSLPELTLDNNPAEVFEFMWNKNSGDLKRFFKNEIDYIPNMFYYPHNLSHDMIYKNVEHTGNSSGLQKPFNKVSTIDYIMDHAEALLFVFPFDKSVNDTILKEWNDRLNEVVEIHNAWTHKTDILQDIFKQPVTPINLNSYWKLAVFNDQTIAENEIMMTEANVRASVWFAILSVFCLFLIIVCTSLKIEYYRKLLCVVAVLFFYCCVSEFTLSMYIITRTTFLRMYLTQVLFVYFLCVFIYFVNRFYYIQCKDKCEHFLSTVGFQCEQKEANKTDNRRIWYIVKEDCFYEFYVEAFSKSLLFVYKMLFSLFVFCVLGFVTRHTLIRNYLFGLTVHLVIIIIVYTFFFNSIFYLIYYKNNPEFDSIKNSWKSEEKVNQGDDEENQVNKNTHVQIDSGYNTHSTNWARDSSRNAQDLDILNGAKPFVIDNENVETKENNKTIVEPTKKRLINYLLDLVGIVLFCFMYFGCIYLFFSSMYKPQINMMSYFSKSSKQYNFVTTLEETAGYIAEPLYLVLPSIKKYNYAIKENRQKIVQLVNELKKEQLVHEPIYSWIHLYELYRNECDALGEFEETFNLLNYKKYCKKLNSNNDNDKKNVNILAETFCEDRKPCESFADLIKEWIYPPDDEEDLIYSPKVFQLNKGKTVTHIDQLFPFYHAIPSHLFYDNKHINMSKTKEITSTRISLMFHNYIRNTQQNIKNVKKIQEILQKYNIEGAYFFSETFAFYNQALVFPKEFAWEAINNMIFLVISYIIFIKLNFLYFFFFWLCSHLSLLLLIYWFPINTDILFFIFFKTISMISIGHYIYTALVFKNIHKKNEKYVPMLKVSLPCFLFFLSVLTIYSDDSYFNRLQFGMVLNHLVWYMISHFVLFLFKVLSNLYQQKKSV